MEFSSFSVSVLADWNCYHRLNLSKTIWEVYSFVSSFLGEAVSSDAFLLFVQLLKLILWLVLHHFHAPTLLFGEMMGEHFTGSLEMTVPAFCCCCCCFFILFSLQSKHSLQFTKSKPTLHICLMYPNNHLLPSCKDFCSHTAYIMWFERWTTAGFSFFSVDFAAKMTTVAGRFYQLWPATWTEQTLAPWVSWKSLSSWLGLKWEPCKKKKKKMISHLKIDRSPVSTKNKDYYFFIALFGCRVYILRQAGLRSL